ncbi:uncharacterized protein TNCV_3152371 [Trichonephila clavipes]|nr:uncharacterized protein TNCV_3152371 [Trichonephila clavipes]
MSVKGSTRNDHRDYKCTSAKRLRMVREDTGAPSEGSTFTWIATDDAVSCTRAFRTMWRCFQRLVNRGCPEPDLRVNDIYLIHWSQYLHTTQSEWLN